MPMMLNTYKRDGGVIDLYCEYGIDKAIVLDDDVPLLEGATIGSNVKEFEVEGDKEAGVGGEKEIEEIEEP
ncbi:conserved hypothetical protein [Ricinus communis]|uniref:Uncharacterized protein n=1 Tax=Ricinus communis TaxID=3988 RepID=B9T3I3_RICCO|nr:conserved hypothetical protein [Ricinus communis]